MNLPRTAELTLTCHEREKLKTLDRHPNSHHENRGYAALFVLEDFLKASKLLEQTHQPDLLVLEVCKVKEGKCKLLTLGNTPGDEKSFDIVIAPLEWHHAARIRVTFPDKHGKSRSELLGFVADYNRLHTAEVFKATQAPRHPLPKQNARAQEAIHAVTH